MLLDTALMSSIEYINQLDTDGKTSLFYLNSLEEIKSLILQGADPLLLPRLDHYDAPIKEYIQGYINKLLDALIHSTTLYQMYQELHLKAESLPMYKKDINQLITTLNMGFEIIAKTVNHEDCCYHCLKADAKVMRCVACKTCWYCSAECQRKDWKNHAKLCSMYKEKLNKLKLRKS